MAEKPVKLWAVASNGACYRAKAGYAEIIKKIRDPSFQAAMRILMRRAHG